MRRQADELSEEWVRLYNERARCKDRAERIKLPDLPNILYIHSHDTGRWVRPYGYSVRTPNIQRLAEEGVLFRKAFCAAPTCSGSRACLLTGQYAHSNGMVGLAHRGFSLKDYRHHIVHTLRELGYWSALIGEQHISKKPDIIGYDEVVKISTSHTDDVVPVTLDLLERASDRPFFLSVGFFETHREWFRPSSPKKANYVMPPPNLPDAPETRLDMAAFQESARSLDRGIGAVLDALDAEGLAEDTLVICTTDHGLAFPGAKATLYDRGLGVMLILRGPGGFTGGKASDALVSHIDLFPTVCELAGDRPARVVAGRVAAPARKRGGRGGQGRHLRGEDLPRRLRAGAVRAHPPLEVHQALRESAPDPSCRTPTTGRARTCCSPTGGASVRSPRSNSTTSSSIPTRRTTSPKTRPTRIRWRSCAGGSKAWMVETKDPLLDGDVPAPEGAELNDPDGLSPNDPTIVV